MTFGCAGLAWWAASEATQTLHTSRYVAIAIVVVSAGVVVSLAVWGEGLLWRSNVISPRMQAVFIAASAGLVPLLLLLSPAWRLGIVSALLGMALALFGVILHRLHAVQRSATKNVEPG
jgi:hypothetical protein